MGESRIVPVIQALLILHPCLDGSRPIAVPQREVLSKALGLGVLKDAVL
jgi:hypothetical protein